MSGAAAPTCRAARFATGVWLSKREVFAACQALADADRVLCRWGREREARALFDLFELFEDRLSEGAQPDFGPDSGSYSSESELTQ